MTHSQYIYKLFSQEESDNIIEVFNWYDGRYGNIFYQGKEIAQFYKEVYTEYLSDYKMIKKLEKNGVDIENTKVIIYDLENLRKYQYSMTVFDAETGIDEKYSDLFDQMKTDLSAIKQAILQEEKEHTYYKFISFTTLDL